MKGMILNSYLIGCVLSGCLIVQSPLFWTKMQMWQEREIGSVRMKEQMTFFEFKICQR